MAKELAMLDYLLRAGVDLANISQGARLKLNDEPWPEEDECDCKCCSRPKSMLFYDIPGKGAWLIEAHDHVKKLRELQIRFPGTVPHDENKKKMPPFTLLDWARRYISPKFSIKPSVEKKLASVEIGEEEL